MLENQIYVRNFDKALATFVKAHGLLTKIDILDDQIDKRYYQFRVARSYKDYHDVFYDSFDDQGKKVFLDRCKEMQKKLNSYIKSVGSIDDVRNDIMECKRNLEYILSNK